MSNKVLNHPDKEDIIRKLLEGESVKEVERWLIQKYPRTKRLHVSYMTLQKFRTDNLNLRGEVLEDIKNKRAEVDKQSAEAEAKMIINSSSAYQQKISEIASSELDVTRRLLELDALVNSRIEYYFNLLQQGGSIREDKIMLEYINTMKSLMQDWKKYIEGFADKKVEHNININVINEQARMLKEAVIEVLRELNPELTYNFINSLDLKMRQISYSKNNIIEGSMEDDY
jgi:hypothetical protein